MPSLRELQVDVMRALLGEPGCVEQLIAARGIPPLRRLQVYANTAQENFITALASSYPVIRRLVGEDYFRQCARAFQHRHPSLSGDLQPAGERFADHLSAVHGNDEYVYLGDVARLEWSVQQSLLAADHAPLDLQKLAAVAPAAYDAVHFLLHPAAQLFVSEYPCVHIWRANTDGAAQPESIDLSEGADRVLLMRRDGQLVFLPLSSGELGFLRALESQAPFAAAVRSGAAAGGFDATAALQRFVSARVIVDFHRGTGMSIHIHSEG